jgi:hypothetical protein
MLNRFAQPTNRTRPRRIGVVAPRLSAARVACLGTIAILISLATPAAFATSGAAAAAGGSGAWPWPLVGEVITPYKNGSDPYAAGQHRGLDIAAPTGMQVRAIVDGRVSFSGPLPDGGQTVTVRSDEYLISDLHLASRAVARGDAVSAGTVVGAVGMSGKRSIEQPHLHLSVRRAADHAYVDPMTLLGPQRLPETPTASAPAAASKPVAKPAQARPHAAPLESGARASSKVHAQSTGDTSSAQSHRLVGHGATGRSSGTSHSADASAREGHAADHISRVAPPPLAQPKTTAKRGVAAPVVSSDTAANERPAARQQSPNRPLLFAVALVCLIALAMRRRAGPAPRRGQPNEPAEATDSEQRKPADVIPLHRAS